MIEKCLDSLGEISDDLAYDAEYWCDLGRPDRRA